MEPAQFFTASRVLIVAGKGGVGKTTVAATLARAASRLGSATLLVEVEGKSGLGRALGVPALGYEPQVVPRDGQRDAELEVRAISPERALADYLDQRELTRVLRRLQGQRLLDLLASSTPGVNDLLVLGKVKQIEKTGRPDLIIVDAPAAGHAMTFLRSAVGVLDSVESGPIRDQAEEVDLMLTDPARCQVLLITMAEETPVNETIETAYRLEDEVGVKLGPVVVNAVRRTVAGLDRPAADAAHASGLELDARLLRALDEAGRFHTSRTDLQREQLARLADELPLEQLRLPLLNGIGIGPVEVAHLATELVDQLSRLAAPAS